jgi:7-cyano-7-deazaguanine tRNA-ribosyltransferase
VISLFEITSSDLLGRKGIIQTKKGPIHTPAFVPVVHPEFSKNFIDVKKFHSKFNIDFIITSSYILKKRFGDESINLHDLTGFQGPIMTDSGAYQSLVYGEIEFTPQSVVEFQENIGSDFAVPLDIPVALIDSYPKAKKKTLETIKRSKNLPNLVSNDDTHWVAPIQGGRFLDLVERSAKQLSQVNLYKMFAIGSVVEIMKNYQYDTLIDIILTAKKFLDPSKPVHLFGAGHPSMFPFIVAAGCDTFDSAAYALYAQEGRYLTNTQTFLLSELDEFPCNCPVCSSLTPSTLREMAKPERMRCLATHNLYVCQTEIMNIRRAISSGTLWSLLESRSRVHPNLKKGYDVLLKHSRQLVSTSPSTKKKGLFFVSSSDIVRPEVLLHYDRINQLKFKKPKLLLISLLDNENIELYEFFKKIKSIIMDNDELIKNYEIWILTGFYGIIPLEIGEVFPLSQSVFSHSLTNEQLTKTILKTLDFIENQSFSDVYLIGDLNRFLQILPKIKSKINFKGYSLSTSLDSIQNISSILNLIIKG